MTTCFEDMPANDQNLTFCNINSHLEGRIPQKEFPQGLKNSDDSFNNFAYMLSDQCPWHIVLRADGRETVYDGPLPKQMHDCFQDFQSMTPIVKLNNRIGQYKRFPGTAVQEAIVNSIIHFDASLMRPIVIDVDRNVVRVSSPGGVLPPEFWVDMTSTNPRNRKLSKLMVSMNLATLKGRGLEMIRGCYHKSGMVPHISRGADFHISLPSIDGGNDIDGRYLMVLDYARDNRGARIADMSSDLMVSVYILKKLIADLEERDMIFTMGIGLNRRVYIILPKTELISEKLSDIRSSAEASYFFCRQGHALRQSSISFLGSSEAIRPDIMQTPAAPVSMT